MRSNWSKIITLIMRLYTKTDAYSFMHSFACVNIYSLVPLENTAICHI